MPQAEPRVWICGLDLSGPSRTTDTALAWFAMEADGLRYASHQSDLSDAAVCIRLSDLCAAGQVAVAIDAPLSYEDGGGYRPCDGSLKSAVTAAGRGFVGVMAPTMTRMAYLTLRGIGLARRLEGLGHGNRLRIVEVHPGAVMALRGAPPRWMRSYKKGARTAPGKLVDWLGKQGLYGLPGDFGSTSHEVDAAAAALGAWHWHTARSAWLWPAEGPHMPYDFAC
jgi:predicted nuclease with RNAse H fold